ncbi:MAG: cysteine rich repeat-containing protein [Nitrospirota bacterium]|nr:cysteine rich repeat-containing protein [Nitrospirota bacterium]
MAKPRWLNGTIGTRGLFLLWASMVLLQGVAVPSAAAQTDRIPPEIAVNTKELKKSCEADYKKLCPDVRMGGGRIVRCLKEHDADLSAPCRQVVAPAASK